MVSRDPFEECRDKNISIGGSDLPFPEMLVENSKLHQFVTNPNLKSEGNGIYSINFTDTNYIESENHITISREERLDPEGGEMIVRVDFKKKTAILIDDEEIVDLSEDYFIDTFIEPRVI